MLPEATVKVPPVLLNKAPPRPPGVTPSAIFPVKVVAASTARVPPLLKIPPPPVASPLARLSVIVTPLTVMVPEPFHNPPPSKAVLSVTLPPLKTVSPAPVIWYPPPFPGAGPFTVLLFKSILLKV